MQRARNVLFLCTGNSARSIMAESILRRDGQGRFHAFSAASHPRGAVHPMALGVLAQFDYPASGFRSKSWDEFALQGAPKMDFVFTVCDAAAGEACPIWPGHPATAHWGIEDPAAVVSGELQQEAAFARAFTYLRSRIAAFIALPIENLDRPSLTARLKAIGQMEGATGRRVPSLQMA